MGTNNTYMVKHAAVKEVMQYIQNMEWWQTCMKRMQVHVVPTDSEEDGEDGHKNPWPTV